MTTLSGVGNLAKFRHLAKLARLGQKLTVAQKATQATRAFAATVEISSGTINALLKLTGVEDEPWAQDLQEVLFYLELISLGAEVTNAVRKGLRSSAGNLLTKGNNGFEKHLDNLVKKGEIDEISRTRILNELEELGLGISAPFAKRVSKALDDAPNEIKSFEKKFLNKEHEWGKIVNKKTGLNAHHTSQLVDEIKWPERLLKQARNSIVTHNHPNSSGLSIADIEFFLSNKLKEIRCFGPDGSLYSLKNLNLKGDDFRDVLDEISEIKKEFKLAKEISVGDLRVVQKREFKAILDVFGDKVEYINYH